MFWHLFSPVDVHFKQLSETGSIILFSIDSVLKCWCFWHQDMCRDLWMWLFFICAQGLGLLINLVEYSARNRHYLVDMEVDLSYLMVTEVDVKTENDVKTEGEVESKTDEQNEDKTEGEKGPMTAKLSNALAALVQVIVVSAFGLRDGFIWPCRCLSLNLITIGQLFVCVVLSWTGTSSSASWGTDRWHHKWGAQTSGGPEWRVEGNIWRDPVGRLRNQRHKWQERRGGRGAWPQ